MNPIASTCQINSRLVDLSRPRSIRSRMTSSNAQHLTRRTAIAAHRGGARLWPENSRQAFRNASRMAVDFIEFDVHRSRDGHLLVHHDAELGRPGI